MYFEPKCERKMWFGALLVLALLAEQLPIFLFLTAGDAVAELTGVLLFFFFLSDKGLSPHSHPQPFHDLSFCPTLTHLMPFFKAEKQQQQQKSPMLSAVLFWETFIPPFHFAEPKKVSEVHFPYIHMEKRWYYIQVCFLYMWQVHWQTRTLSHQCLESR